MKLKKRRTTFGLIQRSILAYSLRKIKLREPISVSQLTKVIETTVGRLMFNERFRKDFGFINEAVKASGIKKNYYYRN
jgi:DNA-directed RNA polymerase subunit beta'